MVLFGNGQSGQVSGLLSTLKMPPSAVPLWKGADKALGDRKMRALLHYLPTVAVAS